MTTEVAAGFTPPFYARTYSRFLTYGVAVASPSLVLLVVLALQRGGHLVPLFPFFTLSVILTALLGGRVPGLIAVGSSLLYIYTVIMSHYVNVVGQRSAWLSFLAFGLVGCSTSVAIGALRTSQKALWKSSVRYRSLFESIEEGFCTIEVVFDEEGKANDWRYLEANPAFRKQMGIGFDPCGRTAGDVNPHVEPEWFDTLGSVAITGEPTRYIKKSGSRWFEGYAFRVERPEQRRVAIVFKDITDRKLAEDAIRKSEQAFRSIFELSTDLTCVVDTHGYFCLVNPAFERVLGYSKEELLAKPFVEFIVPEDREKTARVVTERMERGEAIEAFENRYIRKDGTQVNLEWVANAFVGGRALAIARDITSRKRAEESLIRNEKLAAAGRLAATIAHEVNNPLAAATNALYLVATDPTLRTETKQYVTLVDQELRRAAHITQQTLGFYRENGNRTLVAIPKLIDEVLALYAGKLQSRNVTVLRRYKCGPCAEGCEGCFLVNAGEMRQIVSNLVANGIDALPNSGAMQIRVSRLSNPVNGEVRIQLTMADNGCGIRVENLKRIFEPFYTTKQDVGTGLGLWVTQELVRKHDGRIRVRSSQGKGTVFRITFPAMASPGTKPDSSVATLTA